MRKTIKAGLVIQVLAFLVFLLSYPLGAAVLTETVYIVPPAKLDLKISLNTDDDLRMLEKMTMGFSPLTDLSIFFSVSYIDHWRDEMAASTGDFGVKFKYYLSVPDNGFSSAILLDIRIPAGRDAYSAAEHRNLSFGNNEISAGYILRYDSSPFEALHLNINYTVREANGEDLYSGFYFNPSKSATYLNLLGFNPVSEEAFLYYKNLNNDYLTIGFSAASERFYPLVFVSEMLYYFRPYMGTIEDDEIPVAGLGAFPLLLSAEGRYFYDSDIFFSLYFIIDVSGAEDYPPIFSGAGVGFLL